MWYYKDNKTTISCPMLNNQKLYQENIIMSTGNIQKLKIKVEHVGQVGGKLKAESAGKDRGNCCPKAKSYVRFTHSPFIDSDISSTLFEISRTVIFR